MICYTNILKINSVKKFTLGWMEIMGRNLEAFVLVFLINIEEKLCFHNKTDMHRVKGTTDVKFLMGKLFSKYKIEFIQYLFVDHLN